VQCNTKYLNDRCDRAHGQRVGEVIGSLSFKVDRTGEVKLYTSGDLQYDINGKRLELTKQRPGKLPKASASKAVSIKAQPACKVSARTASKHSKKRKRSRPEILQY
jgi:hypothetical protein